MKASLSPWMSGLCVLLIVPFFFIGGPGVFSSTLVHTAWNFGHIIFFSLLLLLIQFFKPLERWQEWVWVTLIALLIGVLIEYLQHFVGRESSAADVLHNMLGVWLGLFWGQKPTRLVWGFRILSVAIFSPSLWLLITTTVVDVEMRNQFPQINSFDSPYELQQIYANPDIVQTRQVDSPRVDGSYALQINFSTKKYSGFRLVGPYGDWAKYTYLTMDFYNPSEEPLEISLRISDRKHDDGVNNFNDRFNRRLQLTMGWNKVRIGINEIRNAPLKREMNMDEISGFVIFVLRLPRPRRLYWDNIRLE